MAIAIYNIYTTDLQKVFKILYGIDRGLRSVKRAKTVSGKIQRTEDTIKTVQNI